jgi:hypothetical protein
MKATGPGPLARRRFLGLSAAGTLAALGDLGLPRGLPPVSAADARVDPARVQLRPEIEPLVRLLEETPWERVLEELGARIRRGLAYPEALAALLLAGVRNIQPRPVGFKFHAVLVVNSAHLASVASPASDRWLPLLWAVNQFKVSQAADVRAGDWTLGPVDEQAVPPAHKARAAFVDAMDRWDEAAADAAIAGLARTAAPADIFEILARYGARDFREIGHKAIYVANSFRTLDAVGWQHAEPVLRSLAYALLDREGAAASPATSDYAADRPYRFNQRAAARLRAGWADGKPGTEGAAEMLRGLREATPDAASGLAIDLLNRGVAPQAIFEACFEASAELMMRAPGIVSLHATTFTNAVAYAWQRCRGDDTRRLLLLQNASFLPLFRGSPRTGPAIDALEPLVPRTAGPAAIEEILADLSSDRTAAARRMAGYLQRSPDLRPLADAIRRLIFLKGTDSHDYKYSSAVLDDVPALAPATRARMLAGAAYYFRGSADPDTPLAQRARSALAG